MDLVSQLEHYPPYNKTNAMNMISARTTKSSQSQQMMASPPFATKIEKAKSPHSIIYTRNEKRKMQAQKVVVVVNADGTQTNIIKD